MAGLPLVVRLFRPTLRVEFGKAIVQWDIRLPEGHLQVLLSALPRDLVYSPLDKKQMGRSSHRRAAQRFTR